MCICFIVREIALRLMCQSVLSSICKKHLIWYFWREIKSNKKKERNLKDVFKFKSKGSGVNLRVAKLSNKVSKFPRNFAQNIEKIKSRCYLEKIQCV